MRVFRVHLRQNIRKGPFTTGYAIYLRGLGALPEPENDGIKNFCWGSDYSACASVDALLMWFGGCVHALRKYDFVVSVIDVSDAMVKKGKHQVAVKLCEANVISTVECVDMFDLYDLY